MAAGDVTIQVNFEREIRNRRVIMGKVVLDGTNPTPVDLSAYMLTLDGALANLQASAPPGDDPITVMVNVSGTTLNIEVYKYTSGTDATLVDSADATSIVSFIAWGKPHG